MIKIIYSALCSIFSRIKFYHSVNTLFRSYNRIYGHTVHTYIDLMLYVQIILRTTNLKLVGEISPYQTTTTFNIFVMSMLNQKQILQENVIMIITPCSLYYETNHRI